MPCRQAAEHFFQDLTPLQALVARIVSGAAAQAQFYYVHITCEIQWAYQRLHITFSRSYRAAACQAR